VRRDYLHPQIRDAYPLLPRSPRGASARDRHMLVADRLAFERLRNELPGGAFVAHRARDAPDPTWRERCLHAWERLLVATRGGRARPSTRCAAPPHRRRPRLRSPSPRRDSLSPSSSSSSELASDEVVLRVSLE